MSNDEQIRNNIVEAYNTLIRKVPQICGRHGGDNLVINRTTRELRTFTGRFIEHVRLFTDEELECFHDSISLAWEMLVEARERVPERRPLQPVTYVQTGKPGRPRIHIDPQLLVDSMGIRGSMKGLAVAFQCSSRTIRRIALAAQLVEPGAPVISHEWDEEGNMYRIHNSTTPRVAALSDNELDEIIGRILRRYPMYGRGLLLGALKSRGYNVPQPRVTASFVRLRGVPRPFGRNPNHNRKYKTNGPLSSVHHDGQHGLIRYKIVIHCFIDGFSRLIMGIRAHNNNRAQTVLDLFLSTVIADFGVPIRVRGDHGVENVLVAEWMFRKKGSGKKPYIWGPSKNNTRCERVWYDMSDGCGNEWKDFFMILEEEHELDVDNSSHLWLLHILFLPAINDNLVEWSSHWNSHTMNIRDERDRSPEDMWHFGIIEYGLPGQEDFMQRQTLPQTPSTSLNGGEDREIPDVTDDNEEDEDQEDEEEEGGDEANLEVHVDEQGNEVLVESGMGGLQPDGADIEVTEVLSEDVRRILHDEADAEDGSRSAVVGSREANPFITANLPRSLSRVSCNAPYCPLTRQQLGEFIDFLETVIGAGYVDKDTMVLLWVECLRYCRTRLAFD